MGKTITQKQYADGLCVCFDCKLVNICEYRSRYATRCAAFKQSKP